MSESINITDNIEKIGIYSHCLDAIETGLIFEVEGVQDFKRQVKEDRYKVPVEFDSSLNKSIEVPMSREDVPKTYQKVVEVYEMNKAEISVVNKIRYILKLIFKSFYKGDYLNLWCAGISYGFITYDLIDENYLGALIMFTYSLIYTDLGKGIRVLKDYFTSKTREELEIFLEKYGVLDYTNAMKDENDVKMYVKFKGGK